MLAVATCNGLVDRLFNKLQARHGEQSYPEGRLPLVIGAAFLLPITVVLYGAAPQFHWPVWVLLSIVVVNPSLARTALQHSADPAVSRFKATQS